MNENNPFARLPEVASFTLRSDTISAETPWPTKHMSSSRPGGTDTSPHLQWSGAPDGTKSYAVTIYDPDAPTGSGVWHWAVANIPSSVTELKEGAGSEDGQLLPEGAVQVPNDARARRYFGAAPPPGHGAHRYFVVVHALDVDHLELPPEGTPAFLGFSMFGHALGRAVLIVTAETPA